MCAREGCTWRCFGGKKHCSGLCAFVAAELDRSVEICSAVSGNAVSPELWGAVTTLNDSLTDYRRVRARANAVKAGKL